MLDENRRTQIEQLKKKLIKQAVFEVYGDPKQDQDINFKEVIGTVEDKEVKITSVNFGKVENASPNR